MKTSLLIQETPLFFQDLLRELRSFGMKLKNVSKKKETETGSDLLILKQFQLSLRTSLEYIKKELETIVGLQTDAPLRRGIKPFGGVRVVENALKERGIELAPRVKDIFHYAKTTMMQYSQHMMQNLDSIDQNIS